MIQPALDIFNEDVADNSIIKAKDLAIEPCLPSKIKWFIEQYHYSHNINGVHISCCFSVKHNGTLVGGVIYGKTATTAWKRYGETEHEVLELRRLALLDRCGRNSESRTIGWTLRWIAKNMAWVKTVISYADPNYGHTGIIYRASNFEYHGQTATDTAYLFNGKSYHSRALRNKHNGKFKPFVVQLREAKDSGQLKEVILQGKHIFVYRIRR